jgi:hypothetical protein
VIISSLVSDRPYEAIKSTPSYCIKIVRGEALLCIFNSLKNCGVLHKDHENGGNSIFRNNILGVRLGISQNNLIIKIYEEESGLFFLIGSEPGLERNREGISCKVFLKHLLSGNKRGIIN